MGDLCDGASQCSIPPPNAQFKPREAQARLNRVLIVVSWDAIDYRVQDGISGSVGGLREARPAAVESKRSVGNCAASLADPVVNPAERGLLNKPV